MAHEHEYETGGGPGFMLGLLTGTVLGAGLGMLFAPKSGSELRHQISDTTGQWKTAAGQQYRRATEAAGTLAEKGQEAYDRARSAVGRGAEEARRYVSAAQREVARGAEEVMGRASEQIGRAAGRPEAPPPERFTPGASRT